MKVVNPRPIQRVAQQKKKYSEAEASVSPRRSSKRLKGKMNYVHSTDEREEQNPPLAKGEGEIAELKVLIRRSK